MTRKTAYILCMLIFCLVSLIPAQAQMSKKELKQLNRLEFSIVDFFNDYNIEGAEIPSAYENYKFNRETKILEVFGNSTFAQNTFTELSVQQMYENLKDKLNKPFKKFSLIIYANNTPIEQLIVNEEVLEGHTTNSECYWGDINYRGKPWVRNISSPYQPSAGLQNRHLSVWASHGIYYDHSKNTWKWQRPPLFLTREDLFTQTIVIPYLIPMLENAGAVVFTPRERDWQRNEVIIDNDMVETPLNYAEYGKWESTYLPGFSWHNGTYTDGENPFIAGTCRMTETTNHKGKKSIVYTPSIPENGQYAVYVSYQTLPNSIDDAHYTVYHKGGKTEFVVNQQMGGQTWVYLGTFSFDKGISQRNSVVITNESAMEGIVTSDAVRFGGGMGNIERNGYVSGFPRCLEGARYYAQWAGMGYDIYSSKNGKDDYSDDINTRGLMTNYLSGGSIYKPDTCGLRVPIELCLAVHSNAGYNKNGNDIFGTLGICTTLKANADTFKNGHSRNISAQFATSLKKNISHDIREKYGTWTERELRNKSYSESRIPEVPSAIIETLSHQSFPDMRMAWDPNFRHDLARSMYKTIAQFVNNAHGTECTISPQTPDNFQIEFVTDNQIRLSWLPAKETDKGDNPTSYILYTQIGDGDFNNGTMIRKTSHTMPIEPYIQYNFKVVAVNDGGKSFPTEILSAYYVPSSTKKILIVNGFHRLSSPAIINDSISQGFDIDADPGMWKGKNPGWCGKQASFDKSKMGSESYTGLGYTNGEYAGFFFMGNNEDNTATHTDAIAKNMKYTVCSCSADVVMNGKIDLRKYDMVDLILGNECDDGHSLVKYKTFPQQMQEEITRYLRKGGALMVSGSYVASDMRDDRDSIFIRKNLHLTFAGTVHNAENNTINGLGTSFSYYSLLNEEHYAATTTDILQPVDNAFVAMQYSDGSPACVAHTGKTNRTFIMGLPFECIRNDRTRASLMNGILKFLLE